MFRDGRLDYRTREAKLFEILGRRYRWDVAKVCFVALLLLARLYLGLHPELIPFGLAIEGFTDFPSLVGYALALFTIYRQIVNIDGYRHDVLGKARRIALKHGKRKTLDEESGSSK